MRLWYSTASPYVRKVLALLHYHDLIDNVELKKAEAFDPLSEHNKDNPLGRIPALEINDGSWLYDSRVITEYVDYIGKNKSVFPTDNTRWSALKIQALADGIVDNSIPVLAEKRFRKDGNLWLSRHDQILRRNKNSLAFINDRSDFLGENFTIGTLALVCSFDWICFRKELLELDLEQSFPKLYSWAQVMNEKYDCLQKTFPKAS